MDEFNIVVIIGSIVTLGMVLIYEVSMRMKPVEPVAHKTGPHMEICGFLFERFCFQTPTKRVVPYDQNFMVVSGSDGTLTITFSASREETYAVADPDAVIREILWRKGGCVGPAPNQSDPPVTASASDSLDIGFEDREIGGVRFTEDSFTLPDGDVMFYSEIAGVRNIRNKYIGLEFEGRRRDRKFWTGEDTDTVLEEFVRRCGFVEL